MFFYYILILCWQQAVFYPFLNIGVKRSSAYNAVLQRDASKTSAYILGYKSFSENGQNRALFTLETTIYYQNLTQNNINTKGDVHKDTPFCISFHVNWQPTLAEPVSASVSNENRLPNTAHDN